MKRTADDLTNKKFAETDGEFLQACDKAHAFALANRSPGIKPTARQASKYRNGRGLAFRTKVALS